MADLTRDALIEAAAKATFERQHAADIAASTDIDWRWETLLPDTRDVWREAVTPALDAVLPLIADAIEAEGREVVQFLAWDKTREGLCRLVTAEDAYKGALRLVRSLMGDDGE